jgi:PAS domain S-box-containing protein
MHKKYFPIHYSMDSYQKELAQIKTLLKENPKGMTVTDISRELKINRNSVAKYLDVMRVSGHVEMITFGPAKVFFPSNRVPMSVLLNYVSDYILIIDKNLRLTQVNDAFLEFTQTTRDNILDKSLQKLNIPFLSSPEILTHVTTTLEGGHPTIEIVYQTTEPELYFSIKFIPTILEDGRHATTMVIQNITRQKKAEKALHDIQS